MINLYLFSYFVASESCAGVVAGAEVSFLAGVLASLCAGATDVEGVGFAVSTTLRIISTTMVMPKVQVAFSIKSLVLCTPN